ncbi:hypothetical protein [Paracoccus alcaliphilus]|uniref:hypothetical protein n=1 Tax=Paracoccus alcaliphilus TaxID=34002 RepID=UPI0011139F7E|nr:hypothetical protein [Paracoccus alcaliphilus]
MDAHFAVSLQIQNLRCTCPAENEGINSKMAGGDRRRAYDHITLVIVESDHRVPTLWAELNVETVAQAVEALRVREGVPYESSIGRWPNDTQKEYLSSDAIAEWATANGVQAVVWTALLPGMKGNRGSIPTLDELTVHLAKLEGSALSKAKIYIANAPSQIATPYRQDLAKACETSSSDTL